MNFLTCLAVQASLAYSLWKNTISMDTFWVCFCISLAALGICSAIERK